VPGETKASQSAGPSGSSQRVIERVSPDALFRNGTVKLNIIRRAGDVVVLTEEGKLLFSSDAWEDQVVQVEIMKAIAGDSEDSDGSSTGTNDGPMQVSELLLLRDISTLKN
jgi:hypothetical protein